MFLTNGDEAPLTADATSATEDAYAAYQQYYQQYAQQQQAVQPHHPKPNPFNILKNKQDFSSDLTAFMGDDAAVSYFPYFDIQLDFATQLVLNYFFHTKNGLYLVLLKNVVDSRIQESYKCRGLIL